MSEEYKPNKQLPKSENDTNLIDLIIALWNERVLISIVTIVFILLGLFVAFGSTEEFSSQVKLLPESQQVNRLGNLSGVARQFGLNSGLEPTEGIPPAIYPEIAQSLGLMSHLMEYEVRLPKTDSKVSLFEYFTNYQEPSLVDIVSRYTIELPITMLGWVRNQFTDSEQTDVSVAPDDSQEVQILRFTKDEWKVIATLRERVSVVMDKDNGIIRVTVRMPDGEIAAHVADQVVRYVSDYITNYRTEKARSDAKFIEELYEEMKKRFEQAQVNLAEFTDRQRSTTRATDEIQIQRLQSEFNLTFGLYNSMAERLEQSRIKLQEETPILVILEHASVPGRRSKPNRPLVLVVFTLLGLLSSTAYVWIKPVAGKIVNEIDSGKK